MTNSYLIKYSVKSNIELNKTLQFILEGVSVIAYTDVNQLNPSDRWINRLFLDVYIYSEKIEDAIANSLNYCEYILTLLTLHLATSTDSPFFEKAIDWSPGIIDRDFVQNVILPINLDSTRIFNEDSFSILFHSLQKKDLKYRNNHPERLERAMRWYRKSIIEEDFFSKFSFLWFGLEILNPILHDKYHDEMVNHQKRFYHRQDGKNDELLPLAGIKYLIIEVTGLTYDEWKEFVKIRKIIVHGISPLESIFELVISSIPKLENALVSGIFDCIGVEQEKISELIRPIYHPSSKREQILRVKLQNSDFSLLKGNNLPELVVNIKEYHREGNNEKYETKYTLEYQIHNFLGQVTFQEATLKGTIDPEMKNRNFDLKTYVNKNSDLTR